MSDCSSTNRERELGLEISTTVPDTNKHYCLRDSQPFEPTFSLAANMAATSSPPGLPLSSFFPSPGSSKSGSSPTKKMVIEDDPDDEEDWGRSPPLKRATTSPPPVLYIWVTTDELPAVNHAERYLAMYHTVRALGLTLDLSALYTDELRRRKQPSPAFCYYTSLADQDQRKGVGTRITNSIGNAWDRRSKQPKRDWLNRFLRVPVDPGTNRRVVWIPTDRAKVAVHWLTCFNFNKLPDQTRANWKRFQCSERCTNKLCFRNEHICWESAADNQGRGHGKAFCQRVCTHPGCNTLHLSCRCNNIHQPVCVEGSRPDSLL